MNNKEKYLKRIEGKESEAIKEIRWRIENRFEIKNQQRILLKELCLQDNTAEK